MLLQCTWRCYSGSQGRLIVYERNISTNSISDLNISIEDAPGLLRHQLAPASTSLQVGGQQEQQFMFECVKPIAPGPVLVVRYQSGGCTRDNRTNLPILITTFNEPLQLNGENIAL